MNQHLIYSGYCKFTEDLSFQVYAYTQKEEV